MLRYHLSAPWLLAHRATRIFAPKAHGFRILLFHDVPAENLTAFEFFLAYVKNAHGLITPDQAAAWLAGAPPEGFDGRTPCLLSFDDGFHSNGEAVSGCLDRLGAKALFFVNSGLMDLSGENQRAAIAANIFDGRIKAKALAPHLRLMSWDDAARLKSSGHIIGAHGLTHRRLTKLGGADLEREIAVAGERIEACLGGPVDWYAYAFGDIGGISAEALKLISAKYRYCRSGVRGLNDANTGPFAVRADMIDLAAPESYRKLVLEGALDRRYADARARLDSLEY
ncbi:MAG: polysaccharide deacetylase family protein [Rhodospirillales bacterium]|nr:polysaccharide deacetylase family protein [Rhodospirillales bacterium]